MKKFREDVQDEETKRKSSSRRSEQKKLSPEDKKSPLLKKNPPQEVTDLMDIPVNTMPEPLEVGSISSLNLSL